MKILLDHILEHYISTIMKIQVRLTILQFKYSERLNIIVNEMPLYWIFIALFTGEQPCLGNDDDSTIIYNNNNDDDNDNTNNNDDGDDDNDDNNK